MKQRETVLAPTQETTVSKEGKIETGTQAKGAKMDDPGMDYKTLTGTQGQERIGSATARPLSEGDVEVGINYLSKGLRAKTWSLAQALILLGVALAAVGGAEAAEMPQFVYATTDSGTLYQYRIGPAGVLQPLTPPSFPVAREAVMLALHCSGRFVYAVTVHQHNSGHAAAQVFGYQIKADGTLMPLAFRMLTLAAPADNVTMDPKGRFLFVSGEDQRLFTFRIQHDGRLIPLADNQVEGTFHIDTQGDGGGEATGFYSQDVITLDPTGRFLYLFANTGFVDHREFRFVPYRLDAKGALHALAPVTYGPGENGRCFSTRRGDVLVARSFREKAGTYHFHIGPQGLLTVASPPVLPDQFVLLAAEEPDGEMVWLWSSDDCLIAYRVMKNGRLKLKSSQTAFLPHSIWQVTASRVGHYIYIADYNNRSEEPFSSLLAYAATLQGTLKAVVGMPQILDGVCLSLGSASSPTGAGKRKSK